MQTYSVRIRKRSDGLTVARIPSLSRAVGYGLDQEEALLELFKSLASVRKRNGPSPGTAADADPALALC